MVDLNVKHEAIKLLWDKIRESLGYLEFDNEFLDVTPKAQFKEQN